jgi:hypothetical protein
MRTVSAASVAAGDERVEGLPEPVLEALGELAGAAKEGLLALSVGVGLGVLHELMDAEVVRHEALSDRAGCETSPGGLSQQPREAEGSLDPEPRARAGSSPDNDGSRRDCRTVRAWQARQRGVAEANQWLNPLKTPRSSNPMDMGCRCGARGPVDFAGSWSSVAITSRRRGCVMGAA